jgi:asparaginyl-tRNA synthetase
MATETTIDRLGDHVEQDVTLSGWVYNTRGSGKVLFLILRDGTGLCQAVVEKSDATGSFFDAAKHLGRESSLRVTGTVRAEPRAEGGFELAVTDLVVLQRAEEYPITPKAHGPDFLFQRRHLWLRSKRQHIILRIRHTLIDAVRRFFNDRGFVLVDTPLFSPAAGEGASTLFEVDYFGEPVYLAQTGQLYLESACMAHRKVYCFGPTFRAEKSKTRRHLTEFWMVEPEVAFIDLDGLMTLAEAFICALLERVLADHRADLEALDRDITALEAVQRPFVRLSYTDAVDMLKGPQAREHLEKDLADKTARIKTLTASLAELEEAEKSAKKKWQRDKAAQEIAAAREELSEFEEQIGNIPKHMELAAGFDWGKDLGGSDETIVSRLHDRPVLVHRYPKQAKAFYMKLDREDSRVVLNFDLLAPEGYGEIIGGSAREDDYDKLLERIDEEGLKREPYEWYLDLRRYGSVPHGGFGLGIERTLGWICGLKHVREAIPFARMMGKIYP